MQQDFKSTKEAMQRVKRLWVHFIGRWTKPVEKVPAQEQTTSVNESSSGNNNVPLPRLLRPDGPDDFPTFPPPPPSELLANRADYNVKLRNRKFMAPEGILKDSSLYALYRLYEYFVVDYTIGYRNQVEYFWRQHNWAVSEIPDPKDHDPARYAFLACIPHLLVDAFNRNIKLGLPRDAPAIISPEQVEEYKSRPEADRRYEEVPEWTKHVAPLPETLIMLSHDGILLDGLDDERAEPHFRAKNILFWSPHIHFT